MAKRRKRRWGFGGPQRKLNHMMSPQTKAVLSALAGQLGVPRSQALELAVRMLGRMGRDFQLPSLRQVVGSAPGGHMEKSNHTLTPAALRLADKIAKSEDWSRSQVLELAVRAMDRMARLLEPADLYRIMCRVSDEDEHARGLARRHGMLT